MRISFLSHEFPPIGGGAASALDEMTLALARRGHTVQVLTIGLGRRTTTEKDELSREIVRFGVGRRSLMSPSPLELFRSFLALRWASAGPALRFSPDLILAYFAFPAGLAALSLGKRMNRPVVVSLRGSDVPGFYNGRARRPHYPCGGRWGRLGFLHQTLVRPVWNRADMMMANGQFLASLAESFAPRRDIIILPNGVDTRRFHPPAGRANTRALRVLFVGQLIERKRCVEIVEAMQWLKSEGMPAELTLVGDGPLRKTLATMRGRLSAGHCVGLRGHVVREAMPEIYRDHDVLVHLSRAEGVSNVLLEGLASGLCVVGTTTAVGEVIDGTGAGVLVDEVTPQRVGEVLRALIESPKRRQGMQIAARRLAMDQSWDATAASLEQHVRDVVREHVRR